MVDQHVGPAPPPTLSERPGGDSQAARRAGSATGTFASKRRIFGLFKKVLPSRSVWSAVTLRTVPVTGKDRATCSSIMNAFSATPSATKIMCHGLPDAFAMPDFVPRLQPVTESLLPKLTRIEDKKACFCRPTENSDGSAAELGCWQVRFPPDEARARTIHAAGDSATACRSSRDREGAVQFVWPAPLRSRLFLGRE